MSGVLVRPDVSILDDRGCGPEFVSIVQSELNGSFGAVGIGARGRWKDA